MNILEIIAIGVVCIAFIILTACVLASFIDVDKLNEETSELDEDDD